MVSIKIVGVINTKTIHEIPILIKIEDFLIVFKESEGDKNYYWSF